MKPAVHSTTTVNNSIRGIASKLARPDFKRLARMPTIGENWKALQAGIVVPGRGALVPWLCTPEDLLRLVPASAFWLSEGGGWPTFRQRLLGFSGEWGFNFVSVKGRLTEVQFRNDRPHSPRRTYRRSRPMLERLLGRPNVVNMGRLGQQTWQHGEVHVENHLAPGHRLPAGPIVPVHFLSVRVGV